MCLSWAEMEQSTKESVESLNKNIGQIRIFPLGTVNDLARALGIPLEPEEAINHFSIESVKPLDIGKINDDYFMNVVAIGSIPEAINDVDAEKKTKFGKLAYFMSGIKQLASTQSYSFHVEVDGKKEEIESSTLLIGLTNSVGGFETLLPNAKVDDGKLHLVYLKDSSLIDSRLKHCQTY